MSARKVAQENERVKKLLRHVGVEEEAINSWATENGDDDGENIDSSLERLCLRRAAEGACDLAIADRCDSTEMELVDLGAITAGVPLEQASPRYCPTTMDLRNCKSSVRIENPDTANKSSTLGSERPIDNAALLSDQPPGACESHNQKPLGKIPISDDTLIPTPSAPCKLPPPASFSLISPPILVPTSLKCRSRRTKRNRIPTWWTTESHAPAHIRC